LFHGVVECRAADEPAGERIADGFLELLGAHVAPGRVDERSKWCGDPEPEATLNVGPFERRLVEHDAGGAVFLNFGGTVRM
jgi:hypothetical protein